jgi:hypothetical protein
MVQNVVPGAWLCVTIEEMGHLRPATFIQTNNASIAYDTLKKCCSKAIAMPYYWIKDGVTQGQFVIHC